MATTLTSASPSATSQALATHEQPSIPHIPTKLTSATKLASPSPARSVLQANCPMASPMRRRPTFEVYASSDEDSDDEDDFVDATSSHAPFGIAPATKDSEDAYSTASSDVEPESEYEDAQDSVGLYDMFHSRAVAAPVAVVAEAKRERATAATDTEAVEDRIRERPSFLRKVQRSTDFGPQFGYLRQAALTSASASSRMRSIRTASKEPSSSDEDKSQEESEAESGHPLTRQKRRRFVGEESEREERMANIHVAITPVKVRGSMWECE